MGAQSQTSVPDSTSRQVLPDTSKSALGEAFKQPAAFPADSSKRPSQFFTNPLEIGRENPYGSLNYLKAHATYQNIAIYSMQLTALKGELDPDFIAQARSFLFQYDISMKFVAAYESYLADPAFLARTFGRFYTSDRETTGRIGGNDCNGFCSKMFNHAKDSNFKLAKNLKHSLASPEEILGNQRLPDFKSHPRKGTILHLQDGDWVMADKSPNGGQSNHWGVLAYYKKQFVVIGRGGNGSDEIQIMPLSEFLCNVKQTIKVRRYANPGGPYAQHCQFTVTKSNGAFGEAKLADAPAPALIEEQPPIAKQVRIKKRGK